MLLFVLHARALEGCVGAARASLALRDRQHPDNAMDNAIDNAMDNAMDNAVDDETTRVFIDGTAASRLQDTRLLPWDDVAMVELVWRGVQAWEMAGVHVTREYSSERADVLVVFAPLEAPRVASCQSARGSSSVPSTRERSSPKSRVDGALITFNTDVCWRAGEAWAWDSAVTYMQLSALFIVCTASSLATGLRSRAHLPFILYPAVAYTLVVVAYNSAVYRVYIDCNPVSATAIHEMGHALGLNHIAPRVGEHPTPIMSSSITSRTVSCITARDLQALAATGRPGALAANASTGEALPSRCRTSRSRMSSNLCVIMLLTASWIVIPVYAIRLQLAQA